MLFLFYVGTVGLLQRSQGPVMLAGVELHRYGLASQLTNLSE